MNKSYYVIRQLMYDYDYDNEEGSMIYHYLCGKSTYFYWSTHPGDAREFKSIKEIRTFITRVLKSQYDWGAYNNDTLDKWEFQHITTILANEVITASHTMELLRSVK